MAAGIVGEEDNTVEIAAVSERAQHVVEAVEGAIVGKRDIVRSALAVLLSNGHLLIEDVPGVGKTTLAKALARALGCGFKRIQFTPDLLPSDVTGSSVFNQKTTDFEFRPGPVFANIVLADEINRATPKTQSALLECMEERQVTVDGVTRPLPAPFFVIATQNNIEHSGTYPLPEAQLDRFTARLDVRYPALEDEVRILETQAQSRPVDHIEAVLSADEVIEIQRLVREVRVEPALREFIAKLVHGTRHHPALTLGASPRGTLSLQYASQALASIHGRDYVKPDDIKRMASPVLAHRLVVRPEHRIKGQTAQACVEEVLSQVPVPVGAGPAPVASR